MNFNDHNPPHFHAKYGEYQITVEISSGVVDGKFPKRALSHVIERYEQHKKELLEDWNSLAASGTFKKIDPLE